MKRPATRRRRASRRSVAEPEEAPWTAAYRDPTAEWIEPDGLGGFASGCASGVRTRRYHALLVSALTPPLGRHALVADVDVAIETPAGRFALSSHRFEGDLVHPDGVSRLAGFCDRPWPRWRYRLEDGAEIDYEIFTLHRSAGVVLRWTATGLRDDARLEVRPLLSGRDAHALMHENDAFRFGADVAGGRVAWSPYPSLPEIATYSNGEYAHAPDWYRRFLYAEERARGLDDLEDLASPGWFAFDLGRRPAVLAFVAEAGNLAGRTLDRLRQSAARSGARRDTGMAAAVQVLAAAEARRRGRFASRLHRAADAYLVPRGDGLTVIAGYPWFADWGRDTFIALRGLCFATGRLSDAGVILRTWAGSVTDGLLPNRFVEAEERPEFHSVDAPLWYVVAVCEYLEAKSRRGRRATRAERAVLEGAVEAILEGYARGTRYRIGLDADGLIAAGEPGWQLTWMDAKVGDWVVTPRIGKPVEIQALWLNALRMARAFGDRWEDSWARGIRSFRERFWNPDTGALYDVVDVDHVPGVTDGSIRPNMLLAVGGLPFSLLEEPQARSVVDVAERQLWTRLGPRSLSPEHPDYRPVYAGGPRERDAAYHQGTVWPWLADSFVDAWVRVRGGSREAKLEARRRFVQPLLDHLDEAGLGHVSEIADGQPPNAPKGCPFQAWSVGALLRLTEVVLAGSTSRAVSPADPVGSDEAKEEALPGVSRSGVEG